MDKQGVMDTFGQAFVAAFDLIRVWDPELVGIVTLSLGISLSAVAISAALALPLAATLAVTRFPGRGAVIVVFNALLGLPPVVVGLAVYLLLSRAGPLGAFGLLFTPTAMVIAQAILITPIITAIAHQQLADLFVEYEDQLRSFQLRDRQIWLTLLWEGRYSLTTAVLAGFGRAVAEVGAVMIVGGNIAGVTRVMTTAIALETSKGDLALALGLGMILILVSLAVSATAFALRGLAAGGFPTLGTAR